MSIMQSEKYCFLCGATSGEHLDRHHIFPSSLRNQSEKYGLWVYLCHNKCHLNGVHKHADMARSLKKIAQAQAMDYYNWSVEDWRKEFYKNYLEENA